MIRFLFFVFLFTQAASAKIKAEDLRFDGRLDFGIKDGVTESSDEIYELEIDVETKRNNGNKLEIEIESNSETNVFQLNEGFVDHEFQSQNRLLFGKGKKTLGFEYENDKSERLAISRSLVYQYIEVFNFVGYDFFTEYEWRIQNPENEKSYKLATLSVHSNQSEDIGFIYSRLLNPDYKSWKTMLWALFQADKARRDYQAVGLFVIGAEKRINNEVITFEFFYGKDPVMSEFERDYNNNEEVFFAGLKTEYGYRIEDYMPYIQLGYVAKRIDVPGFDQIQLLLGTRFFLDEDLSFAFEIDGQLNSSELKPWIKYADDSEFKIELRYLF